MAPVSKLKFYGFTGWLLLLAAPACRRNIIDLSVKADFSY